MKDGLSSWCKPCQRAWQQAWDKEHAEKRRAHGKAYYQRNRAKLLAANREYRKRKPEIVRKAQRRWEEAHPEYRNEFAGKIRERNRLEAFAAYGGFRCACCGETEPMFLTLDHINNDGAEHRRLVGGKGGSSFFAWLRQKKFPPGFQVLCRNCNWGKHANGGVCPHQKSEGSSTIPEGSTPQATGGGSAERPASGR